MWAWKRYVALLCFCAAHASADPPPVKVYKKPQQAPAAQSGQLEVYSGPTGVAEPMQQKLEVYSKPPPTAGVQRGQSQIGIATARRGAAEQPGQPQQGPGAAPPKPLPVCLKWMPIVNFRGFGYNHVVRIESECKETYACSVSTNVNPTPVSGQVPPGGVIELLTYTGSPSASFIPNLACKVAGS